MSWEYQVIFWDFFTMLFSVSITNSTLVTYCPIRSDTALVNCLLIISMRRDYVSELQPPMGLLSVPQVIHEYGEPRWNDIDRENPKNSREQTVPALLCPSELDWPWREPGFARWEADAWAMVGLCQHLVHVIWEAVIAVRYYGYIYDKLIWILKTSPLLGFEATPSEIRLSRVNATFHSSDRDTGVTEKSFENVQLRGSYQSPTV
jgi:hypothetical protein